MTKQNVALKRIHLETESEGVPSTAIRWYLHNTHHSMEEQASINLHFQGDCCSERAQPPNSGETSGRGCCWEEIVSCVWAFGQGATHSLCYLLYVKASPSFQKDLKKLLDDNNRELKALGGSGGGLPQDLVRFHPELHGFNLAHPYTGEVLSAATPGGDQLLPPEQGVAQVRLKDTWIY